MDKEKHYEELEELIQKYIRTTNQKVIISYLEQDRDTDEFYSPELLETLGEIIEKYSEEEFNDMWILSEELINYEENDTDQYIPAYGMIGIVSVSIVHDKYFDKALSKLKELSNTDKDLKKESISLAIQKLLEKKPNKTINKLEKWIPQRNHLIHKTLLYSISKPEILEDPKIWRFSMETHREIIFKIIKTKQKETEELQELKEELTKTLPNLIKENPEKGFEYLKKLTRFNDKDLKWIIKTIIRNQYLKKFFPDKIQDIKNQNQY